MNIFYLDHDPIKCAQYHCDKHIVKMILEYAQLLSTAHHVLGEPFSELYKPTHVNHPCAVWARKSYENYTWLRDLFNACCIEYTRRYGRSHKSTILSQELWNFPKSAPIKSFTSPPQCMPDDCKGPDTVQAYRNYYMKHKPFAKWKHTETPAWYVPQ